MCPACTTTAALIVGSAASATSAGGLAALVLTKLRGKHRKGVSATDRRHVRPAGGGIRDAMGSERENGGE